MKETPRLLCLSCVLLSASLGQGAPFQNLNFEDANPANLMSDFPGLYYGTTADLIPGWDLGSPTIGYNAFAAGFGFATIVDATNQARYPVVGKYTIFLSGSAFTGPYMGYSLSQIGDVPADAKSIHFMTFGAPYALTVSGIPIGLSYDYLPGNYDPALQPANVTGDISAFAGQSVKMVFTTLPGEPGVNGLDEIYFSTQAVPEPSTVLLFSLGGLALLTRRYWRK